MILVVVAMQAVPPYGLKVLQSIHKVPNDLKILCIVGVIDRIGFRHAEYTTIHDITRLCEPDPFQFSLPQFDQIGIWHVPQIITFRTEIFQPQAGLARGLGPYPGSNS